jgi:predicted transposase/invertase (TIGR01784 family)
MEVNGSLIDLEVQVENEGDYPERSLYYWARAYSSALLPGNEYSKLPPVIVISILDESVFDCAEYHSEFRPLEVDRREVLSNRMAMHYFEIRKLPTNVDIKNELELMLSLFRAKTEEDLKKLEALEVPIVQQAIGAYRTITVSDEFKELERLRSDALHNEASALANAERKERAKWQGVVAEKEAIVTETKAALADKEAALAELAARIAELEALLKNKK